MAFVKHVADRSITFHPVKEEKEEMKKIKLPELSSSDKWPSLSVLRAQFEGTW